MAAMEVAAMEAAATETAAMEVTATEVTATEVTATEVTATEVMPTCLRESRLQCEDVRCAWQSTRAGQRAIRGHVRAPGVGLHDHVVEISPGVRIGSWRHGWRWFASDPGVTSSSHRRWVRVWVRVCVPTLRRGCGVIPGPLCDVRP